MGLGNLIVRADAGVFLGSGHVMRCVALAQAWQDREGGNVTLAMGETTPAIDAYLRSQNLAVVPLHVSPGSNEDANRLVQFARENRADWTVLDGAHFGAQYQLILKDASLKLLVIDDSGKNGFFGDIILNQNPHAIEEMYQDRGPHTRLLLGSRYAMLRRQFTSWRDWKRRHPITGSKVLVTLGGSDPGNLTEQIIAALKKLKTPLEAKVIVGGSNPYGNTLQTAVGSASNIEVICGSSHMPEHMAWAEVAVSGGGSTCWEICLLGLPAILIEQAANQIPILRELDRRQCAIHLGSSGGDPVHKLGERLEWLMLSAETRSVLSRNARELVDGRGAGRVVSGMMAASLRLRPAREGDCGLLWELANEPKARAESFSPKPIDWEEHCRWFAERLRRNDTILYIAEDKNETVGVVRYEIVDDTATVSISVAHHFRGKGYGRGGLSLAIQEVFRTCPVKEIRAFVKMGNLPSLRLFDTFGFTRKETENINGFAAVLFTLARHDAREIADLANQGRGIGKDETYSKTG